MLVAAVEVSVMSQWLASKSKEAAITIFKGSSHNDRFRAHVWAQGPSYVGRRATLSSMPASVPVGDGARAASVHEPESAYLLSV